MRLLLPGGRLKPGSEVVILRAFTQKSKRVSTGRSAASAESGPRDTLLEQYLGQLAVVVDVSSTEGICNVNIKFPQPSDMESPAHNSAFTTSVASTRIVLAKRSEKGTSGYPSKGSWVVFKNLKSRPELNGRLGLVMEQVNVNKDAALMDDVRVQVQVMGFERVLGAAFADEEDPPAAAVTVRSLLKNLVCVVDVNPKSDPILSASSVS